MALIGYARVSTSDQELQPQLDALAAAGVDRVFAEHVSSTSTHRPQLAAALDYMQNRVGDVLVVVAIDRLSRSLIEFATLMERFDKEGLAFRSLTQPFDTSTPEGRMVTHLFAMFAQMERETISRRTRAGLESARAQGRVGGRPFVVTPDLLESVLHLKTLKKTHAEIAKALRISERSVSRAVAELRRAGSLS
ncbi:recombinase family protein [Demequina lutea]|uniref:DNA invertase Pin-like site-specific DNA recombinase n=1 Tax=Demequina lutea TaxID=431489 RepID=A0A7Y9ZD08_9MICO|nr:recombinase family protein [Demequina lutea]NYI42861.1 DNA invertase Pin-like site-specific DNA recombinase [Demequina lutea]